MRLRFLYILSFLLLGFTSQAQIYPVQTFIQVSPPYTSYLPDYSNPSNEQLKVFLTLTDMTVPSHEVKIRFRFEGNGYTIENPTYLNLPPIVLTPGTPYEISGAELAYYLNSSNLVFSGIDVNDYENRKVLPEGPCMICVEVLDYNSPNNQVVGNPSCTNVWFADYDPPFLNTPICGSEVSVSDPQQLLFSWSPLNMTSPSGINNVEYVFELFEIRPTGSEPNIVVNSTLPIFMQVTNQSFINYSITEPQLQEGMDYVWRVQVRDNSGRDYFKNQGYSQVCTFTYGNLATSAIEGFEFNLQSEGTGVRQGTAWWSSNSAFDSYVLETRKTGNDDYQWFPTNVMGVNSIKINSLEPETEYECRVKGIVGAEESEWSNISVFTTQPQPNYSCGNTTMPATSPDIVPFQNATEGMVFFVGQFEMTTTSISPLNTPGHYTGTGKINIPFALINLNVSFDDILVDDNLVVRQGKVVAISKGIEAWETDYLNDLCLQNSYSFPGVDTITFPTDSTALVQFGDQTLLIDSLPAAIITPDGYTYYIYEDGTYWVEFSGTISEDNLASSDSLKIIFQKNPFQNYGFDAFENGLWVDSYETIQLGDGSNYFVPYKSIKSGEEDLVYAKVVAPAGFVLDSVSFKCLDGRTLKHLKLNDTIYEITLDEFTAEEEAVYAYWQGNKMGKLNVRAYDEIAHDVILVPVNNASINNQENLNGILNTIYSQAVVSWNMTIDSSFAFADLGTSLESADANLMTKYSPEMRTLRDAYLTEHPEIDNSTYILFVVDQFHDPAIQGYMVRGKNVGFLSANPLAKTIAHELGHGAFGLYHTFPTPPVGSTKNLLDYSAQTHLTKYQWEKIHHWSPTMSFLDDEEEALQITIRDIESVREKFENFDGTLTFLSIGNKPITIQGSITKLVFTFAEDKWIGDQDYLPIGALHSFEVGNKEYKPRGAAGSKQFLYYSTDDGEVYTDSLSFLHFDKNSDNSYSNALVGLPCIKSGSIDFLVFPLSSNGVLDSPEQSNKGEGLEKGVFDYGLFLTRHDEGVSVAAFFDIQYDDELALLSNWFEGDLCGIDAVAAFRSAYFLKESPEYVTCLESVSENSMMEVVLFNWDENLDTEEEKESILIEGIHSMDENTTPPLQYVSTIESLANREFSIVQFQNLLEQAMEFVDSKQLSVGDQKNNSIASIISYFTIQSDVNRECLLTTLEWDVREDLLEAINTWQNPAWPGNWDSDKERLIVDLIRTTPDDQMQALLTYLSNNNFSNYWSLYDDTSGEQNTEYVLLVSSFVLNHQTIANNCIGVSQSTKSGIYECTADSRDYNTLVNCTWGTFHEGQYFPFYKRAVNTARVEETGKVYFFESYDGQGQFDIVTQRYCYKEGSNIIKHLTPFHIVKVEFKENMQFSLPNGDQITKGVQAVMPALWGYWIHDSQEFSDKMTAVRVSANVIAIGITIATWGTTSPIIAGAELVFNAVDISVALSEDYILSNGTPEQKEFLEAYNDFATVLGVTQLGLAGVKSTLKLADIRLKIKQTRQNGTYLSFKDKFRAFYSTIKTLPTEGTSGKSMYVAFMDKLRLEFEINKFANYTSNAVFDQADLTVQQAGHYLFVESNAINAYGTQYSSTISDVARVGTYSTMTGADEMVYLYDLKLYDQTTHGQIGYIVKELDDIHYTSNSSIVEGDIHIVRVGDDLFIKPVGIGQELAEGVDDLLNASGKFIDDVLEADYLKYVTRKTNAGKTPRPRLEWKKVRDYWLNDSPLARGNNFNRKAWDEEWYPFWEVYLDNGKFLDGYNPLTKEVVSRKATDLVDIQESTFIKYLDELKAKYAPPRIIKSQKPGYESIYNQPIPNDAKLILEIPESNRTFSNIERYKQIALDKGITIKFAPE